MKNRKVVAVIPARGGSKGIKDKNIQPVMGVPLVGRSIYYSKKVSEIQKVFVSSDSKKILDVGEYYGAESHIRSKQASSDIASTEDALFDFIDYLGDELPEFLIYFQCTTPFLDPEEISQAMKIIFKDDSVDTIFSGKPVHSFLWEREKNTGYSKGINHTHTSQRLLRQNLQSDQLIEDGGFYILRMKSFLRHRNRFGPRSVIYPSKVPFYNEIDDIGDLQMVRNLGNFLNEKIFFRKEVRVLFSDFDGVMTDDKVFVDSNGNEMVGCSRADGMGIEILRKNKIEVIIISTEKNDVVKMRGRKLRVSVLNDTKNKLETIKKICFEKGISPDQAAFVGNDVNDLEALKWVGTAFIVKNSSQDLISEGFHVLSKSGGEGVVREIASLLKQKK